MTDELTPREVAEELGVTPRTVQRWIADGRLAATRVGGRQRVSRSSLAAVADERAFARKATSTTGPRGISSLLLANRGEVVARLAATARHMGIRTIGVQEDDDRPPRAVDATIGVPSYLDGPAMIAAAMAAGADAVHPGYGFLAEDPGFAEAVTRAGLIWIGPPAQAMAAMGDKGAARRRAVELGIPVLPGYAGAAGEDRTVASEAAAIGYPVLVKPAAGGGGKGIRVVRSAPELADAIAGLRRDAARAFGDDRLILERYLPGSRHVEIQVLFDQHGNGIHLGERDCSAQRRNQKIVEESPAPSVSPALRERMGEAALRLARSVGYVGAGTVEFLVVDDGSFFFLEMNTRLQVEHPVTEMVTGRDLVEDQLRIAEGDEISGGRGDVSLAGNAIEVRVYAEDPDAAFLPATGPILALQWPGGPGIRVDAGVDVGDRVTDRYDPMLAKIVAGGETRDEALARLKAALTETSILGVRTNLRFLRWLLAQPEIARGEMRTDTIERMQLPAAPHPTDSAWRAAARALLALGPFGSGPWGGGWRPNAPGAARLRFGELERRIELDEVEGEQPPLVAVEGGVAYVEVDGQSLELALALPPSIEEAVRHAPSDEGRAALVAPMPGRVIVVRAAAGADVAAHAALIVIEAMKMEHAVTTPIAGRVTRIAVREGDQVQRGDLLAEVTAQRPV